MGRFQTTMAADLEKVTSRLHEVDDRKTVCEKLRERKLGNTQASVVFGFDPVVYETDAMRGAARRAWIPSNDVSRRDAKTPSP